MDPLTALTIAKFVLDAIREGVPVGLRVIEMLKATDDAEAKKLLPEFELEYQASRQAAADAHAYRQGRPD